jgi:hypothetical protein
MRHVQPDYSRSNVINIILGILVNTLWPLMTIIVNFVRQNIYIQPWILVFLLMILGSIAAFVAIRYYYYECPPPEKEVKI